MTEVYRPLYLNQAPILSTGRRTAKLINEIADQVARGIGLDNASARKLLHAGPGFGGSCFPMDTLALIKTGQDFAAPLRIIDTGIPLPVKGGECLSF